MCKRQKTRCLALITEHLILLPLYCTWNCYFLFFSIFSISVSGTCSINSLKKGHKRPWDLLIMLPFGCIITKDVFIP